MSNLHFQKLSEAEMDMCADKIKKWNAYIIREEEGAPRLGSIPCSVCATEERSKRETLRPLIAETGS